MNNEMDEIKELVKRYHKKNVKIIPDNTVPVSGKVYDENELQNMVEASLEGWWTENKWSEEFQKKITEFLGVKYAITVNSGSSANFIAMKTLSSIKLGEGRIKPGDEVITVAAGFPTTINPIIDVGAVPVFVDVELGSYNADVNEIKKAITQKTKAIILAHTLGNPFNISEIKSICEKHKLWLIEDNCDAFGSKYDGKFTGTFGDLATLSFYPAHHITTAEGGAILTNNRELNKIANSIRDWGRDCWCPTGKDNTCKNRFNWKLGELPHGYDHKYIYSEIGYNLKMTDIQAAIGVAQMDKLPSFIEKRRSNFDKLFNKLKEFDDVLILPKIAENTEPSWFGFLITIKNERINREKLIGYLNQNGIQTRLLFAGNITKQPYFIDYNINYRKIGNLKNTDAVMNNTFWIGTCPLITDKHIDYVYSKMKEYLMTVKLEE